MSRMQAHDRKQTSLERLSLQQMNFSCRTPNNYDPLSFLAALVLTWGLVGPSSSSCLFLVLICYPYLLQFPRPVLHIYCLEGLRGKRKASPAPRWDEGPDSLIMYMFTIYQVGSLLLFYPLLGLQTGLSMFLCHGMILVVNPSLTAEYISALGFSLTVWPPD